MLAAVAVALYLALPQKDGLIKSEELNPDTRPFVELAPFKSLKCVTVSQYTSKGDDGKVYTVRVYRFTYPGSYETEMKRWETLFPAKGGWKVFSKPNQQYIIGRDVKHPKIKDQTLLLSYGRFWFDSKAKARTRRDRDQNYISVSFNETLKRP